MYYIGSIFHVGTKYFKNLKSFHFGGTFFGLKKRTFLEENPDIFKWLKLILIYLAQIGSNTVNLGHSSNPN